METTNYWQTITAKRFSRRKALTAGAAGLGAAALGLAGCGGGGGKEEVSQGVTPAATLTPVAGGALVRGVGTDPGSLDVEETVTGYFVGANFFDYLHGITFRDQKLVPLAAEKVEQPDNLTTIWTLRPGIKFHNIEPTNGREVVAADVTYSFDRLKADPASQWSKILLKEYTASYGDTDRYTFKLVTNRPMSPILDQTTYSCFAIQPHEAVEKWGSLAQNPVGSGPYMLDEFVRGERVKARKNPEYWRSGLPYLYSVEWRVVTDNNALLQNFKSGRHDVCGVLIDKMARPEMESTSGVKLGETKNLYSAAVIAKVDEPPFNDERVMQALDYAIDRQDLIDKLNFGEGLLAGPIVGDMEYWALPQDELRDFYKVDIEKAKQLLSAAGYPNGLEFDFTVESIITLPKVAVVLQSHLEKIGVKANIVLKELGVYLAQHLYARQFKLTMYLNLAWSEPDTPLLNWFSKGPPGFSFTGYNNPEMDDWIWKERSEFDPEKRRQIVLDAQRAMIRQHGPQYPLTTQVFRYAYRDYVHFGPPEFWGMGGAANQDLKTWVSPRT